MVFCPICQDALLKFDVDFYDRLVEYCPKCLYERAEGEGVQVDLQKEPLVLIE